MFKETYLNTLSPSQIARAFQTVYTGYLMNIGFSESWVSDFVPRFGIDLSCSPLWLDDYHDPVGLAALGFRSNPDGTERAWLGGFGLAPEIRGQGLSAPLMDALLTECEQRPVTTIQLEVLTTNIKAMHVYESAGFEIGRKVATLTSPYRMGYSEELNSDVLPWDVIEPQHEVLPVWQRQFPWAMDGGGQVLVTDYSWLRFRPAGKRILLFDAEFGSQDDLALAVYDLQARFPDCQLSLANEPVGTPLYAALTTLDWVESAPQWEMVYQMQAQD